MIKTLRSNNGSFVGTTANIQPASPDDNVQAASNQQTSSTTHSMSTSTPPAHQVQLPQPVINVNSEGAKVTAEPTLEQVTDQVINGSDFVMPLRSAGGNIVPTYPLSRDSGTTFDPRINNDVAGTTSQTQAYTRLTGISAERPEIVMMTEFQPLFDRDVSNTAPHYINAFEAAGMQHFLTDAGRYLDAQFHMRNLQTQGIHRSLQAVRIRYAHVEQRLGLRTDDFTRAIFKLKGDASFLLNLVRLIESQKNQFDLRHKLYEVDPSEVTLRFLNNASQQRPYMSPELAPHILTSLVQSGNRFKHDFVDCLIDLGYKEDAVRTTFASTKIWLQTLAELRHILRHHTNRLIDIDPIHQKKDRNPSVILNSQTRYFDLVSDLPQVPSLDDLIKVQVPDVAKTVKVISAAFGAIYQDVFFKNDEARIAGLAHLLTREYRYSKGLGDPLLQQRLQSAYGYQVTATRNDEMFGAILGRLTNNITDIQSTSPGSVSSVSQQTTNNEGVLTFESKYVEGDTGTLVPGSEYYLGRILTTDGTGFNTKAIDSLSSLLQTQADNLSVICDSLGLMQVPAQTIMHRFGLNVPLMLDVPFLENGIDTVHKLADQLINPLTGETQPVTANDKLGAVYAQARNHPKVKSILFLYTLSRLSRAYRSNVPFFTSPAAGDNTPVVDHLIEQLTDVLSSTIPDTRSASQFVSNDFDQDLNPTSLTNDNIKHAMKSGTKMTRIVEDFMSEILNQFKNKTQALSGNQTRYRGALDTIVAMVAFDLAITLISRYSNQSMVGVNNGSTNFSFGQITYIVARNTTNHLTSFNELVQRLSTEGNLTRQLLLTIINSLQKLSGSLRGISNYFNSEESLNKLAEISVMLGNNGDLIHMLFNEQQIMLLASTVESLLTAHARNRDQHGVGAQHRSYHQDGRVSERETAILDESEIAPEVHHALQGYFGAGEFAGIHGRNKRILTVGIPLGFSRNLKQKVNVQSQKGNSFENKRQDIIKVCVYKIDIQNPDIVYRPVKYLFELARFPTRFTTAHWLPLPPQPSLQDIVSSIPTQNFSQDPNIGTSNTISSGVEYASTVIAGNEGVTGARGAFEGEGYSFLSSQQRVEILHNHVASQLLEAYIKLMTGVSVAEHDYNLVNPPPCVEPNFMKFLTDHTLSHMSDIINAQKGLPALSSGGVLFSTTSTRKVPAPNSGRGSRGSLLPVLGNASGVGGQVSAASEFRSVQPASLVQKTTEQSSAINPSKLSLGTLSGRHSGIVLTGLRSLSSFSRTLTSLAHIPALNHKVMSPKQFDRVFNIIVDPRDFLVDVKRTHKTPHGRKALQLMLENGDIVSSEHDAPSLRQLALGLSLTSLTTAPSLGRGFVTSQQPDNVHGFRYRDRDKSQGDLITDKYFVTIESFEEDEE